MLTLALAIASDAAVLRRTKQARKSGSVSELDACRREIMHRNLTEKGYDNVLQTRAAR